jgi:transcriptional regulator with XRE-family HTH domain
VVMQANFRDKVHQALEERGWSQSALAREMNVTRSVVSQYLSGRITPGLDVVEKFANALGVDPWNLVDNRPLQFCSTIT